jgi:hypothetical protein
MKLRQLLTLVLATASLARGDNEIGYIERFALAPDREKVLTELVPGTEDYYFFHALHYQNTRQAPKLATILDSWKKRYPASQQRKVIENREALLAYDADPKRTLEFLTRFFNLQFNHVQDRRDQKPDLPSELDQARIARDAFRKIALVDDNLSKCNEEELAQLVIDKVPLRPAQRRALLARIARPNVPGLIELIAEDLNTPENRSFGESPIHQQLLPEQLDQLAKLVPRITGENAYVYTRIRKLAPGADEDATFDAVAREAWLDRLWLYVKALTPAFNSLKASVLYRRLDHDRRLGVYNAERFVEYLKLPRQTPYASPKWIERLRGADTTWTDLNASYGEAGLSFPPIQNDEPLVRDYFLHLFVADQTKTWEAYAEWVRDTWLKPVYAEAMIVNGVGDSEKWASMLSPAAYQQLKDRVDLDFALENPQFHAPAEEVSIDVFVKNSPKLIVKVYELNALNYFLTNKKQLNTDLPLDGLVANTETTHAYDDSPFRRIRRTYKFPELKGRRGAWVVEFIGGGRSSRALIRKGQWQLIQQTSPAGDLLTVVDEAYAPVKDAAIWLDGRKFTADPKSGAISIPFTEQPGRKPVVIADATGTFATLTEFEHHAEQYQLDAQFHIEQEQLLAGRAATLAIRSALRMHESEASLSLLKDTKLTIAITSLDGIRTTREIKDLKLDAAKVFTHKFLVPGRLESLEAVLSATVDVLSKGGEKQNLQAQGSWYANQVDKTEATSLGHLARAESGYFLELLGKNGEPLIDRQVVITFHHKRFNHEIPLPLRTDARGRIALGELNQIDKIGANLPDGRAQYWWLGDFVRSHNSEIHAVANSPFEIPLNRWLEPGRFTLLEVRNSTFTSDATNRIVLMPMGPYIKDKDGKTVPGVRLPFIPVTGLPPGDYKLLLPDEDRTIDIKVTKGSAVRDWAMNPARSFQLTPPKPLYLARVEADANALVITLGNTNPFTRVHIAATRYISNDTSLQRLLGFGRPGKASEIPARMPNLFAGGRDIGDEYRYILERRYAQKFPGNMLSRPGLLLNPWEKRSTDQSAIEQQVMQRAGATAGARQRMAQPPAPAAVTSPMGGTKDAERIYPNLDFLARTGPVLYNSVPDKDGVVRIDRKVLGDRQLVQIYAEDLEEGVWKQIALPDLDAELKDQRLTRNLDPAKPFAEKKQIDVLQKGQVLTLPDILSSEIETYDTIGSVFSLLQTLSGDETLPKFAWILEWPKMNDADKRAKYSEFACHELHVFLARKDPDFFAKVVQPYLRNKKDKTFIDEYLLGTDLRRYLEPWRFAQLNAAERAFLITRLQADSADIARHLRELWELIPPNPDEADRLFETALRGRSMDSTAGVSLEFAGAKSETALRAAPADAAGAPAAAAPAPPAPKARGAMAGRMLSPAAKESEEALGRAEKLNEQLGVKADAAAAELKRKSLKEADKPALGDVDRSYYAFMDADGIAAARGLAMQQAYYRRLGPTKEWAENNYYHLPIQQQDADLIQVNAFWRDLAAYLAGGSIGPFVSPHIAEAHHTFPEVMLALAVTDLPFEAPKHETKVDGGAFTLNAGGIILAVHKEIKPAAPAPKQTELLVSENFYRFGDRYRNEGNEKFDKYVTDEFLSGAVYGANVVVTNPTSSPQKLELLLQIPRGAISTNGSKPTDSRRVRLEPFTTQSFEYFFYFPSPNAANEDRFPHYPVNVARNEEVVGAAKPFDFRVVKQLSQVDKASWDYISQYGSEADVFAFLDQNNIERLDVTRVAWRCRQNVVFFRKFVALLEKRHHFDPTIYSYAVMHHEPASLGEWLRHRDELLLLCGPWLETKLVKLDPIDRKRFEQLEYSPLVNQRAHRLGAQHRIANNVMLEQYRGLLDILAYKPSLDVMDTMAVTGFLFLQDRVEEGLARLQTVNAEALPTRIQYDYFRCYAALYTEKIAEARGIANQYVNFPVDRWRNLFADVLSQIAEVEGQDAVASKDKDKPDRERDTAELAAAQPTFDFKVENRTIHINWRNLSDATFNYYLIDPEFSFSGNPFVSEDAARFSIIKPTKTASVALPKEKDALDVPLPAEFARANVVVELVAAGQRKAQAYHANTIKLTVAENYGRIEVRDQGNSRAVSKAYVKVYARLKNGTVRFLKDGYTDLRGKFDYASLNSKEAPEPPRPLPAEPGPGSLDTQMLKPGELDQVDRLALLILSDQNGALVKEVNPPAGGASFPQPAIPGL